MDNLGDTPLTPESEVVFPDPRNPAEAIDRRHFLAVTAASAALATVAGCSPKFASRGEIISDVDDREGVKPGTPLTFATAMSLGDAAIGLLATSRDGRPTKIEGNPDHVGSGGATDLFSQAAILDLYDPDRSKQVNHRGMPVTWDDALMALRATMVTQQATNGAGLRVLSGPVISPTLAGLRGELLRQFPKAQWVRYEPCGHDAASEGSRRAFGDTVHAVYDFSKADVILALDADFLACHPGTVKYQRDFADHRRVRQNGGGIAADTMNRLYAVESMLTTTGVNADHRLAVKPSEVEAFARALAAELKLPGAPAAGPLSDQARAWLGPLARDLSAHKGRSLVLVGDGQTVALHALGHALNHALGNIGHTVQFTDLLDATAENGSVALRRLVDDMNAGTVELLLILGVNPAYTAPCDFAFTDALKRVKQTAHLGLYADETAAVCDWHIPETHFLETWGDARGHDGTVLIQQPLIEPLERGHSAIEFLAALLGPNERRGRELVREHWRTVRKNPADFDAFWQRAVQRGLIENMATAPRTPVLQKGAIAPGTPQEDARNQQGSGLELQFVPDPTLHDGRYANNGWLQELPKPVTKLTWGNAAFMSPATAAQLGIRQKADGRGGQHGGLDTDVVELRYRGRTVRAPAFVLPEHADGAVTVHLGHGRERAGRVGNGVGFDAFRLRTSDASGFDRGLEVVRTDTRETLACTQSHHNMTSPDGHDTIKHTTAAKFRLNPHVSPPALDDAAEKAAVTALVPPGTTTLPTAAERDRRLVPLTLYQEWSYPDHKWAMAIDLSACTGCSACVVACQAENNIPVVGKEQVIRSREMHWIRVDRYAAEGRQFMQPVPCMQCENAPCEVVCPVGATVHSHDGLNDMVYNRCVGTRYCSNNCPYKVRRFNFLAYADFDAENLKPLHNPEVTVRSRGVMEKCTYCVQRIRAAEHDAQVQGRAVPDGAVKTACQQACPSAAIMFGNLNDAASQVRKWKAEPHDYALLAELNTRPRTTYLAAVRNPNPDMPGGN